jgi:hypothetical protein
MYRKARNLFFGIIRSSACDSQDNMLIVLFYFVFDTIDARPKKLRTVTKYSAFHTCILAFAGQ